MPEAWISGCLVQRIMFRDGLVMSLDHYNEVVISVPMRLTLPPAGRFPGEVFLINPKLIKDQEKPLFNLPGAVCAHASWNEAGDLLMEFSDQHVIEVPHDPSRTAWEIYGKHHGYVASLPQGKVTEVRHDVLAEGARRS